MNITIGLTKAECGLLKELQKKDKKGLERRIRAETLKDFKV